MNNKTISNQRQFQTGPSSVCDNITPLAGLSHLSWFSTKNNETKENIIKDRCVKKMKQGIVDTDTITMA